MTTILIAALGVSAFVLFVLVCASMAGSRASERAPHPQRYVEE